MRLGTEPTESGRSTIDEHLDFSTATSDEIVSHLERAEFRPRLTDATMIRNRIAGSLGSDPRVAFAMARALYRAVRRSGSPDPDVLATALRSRAEAALYVGRWRAALRDYEAASDSARGSGSSALLGEILVGQVGALAAVGRTTAAQRIGREAQRLLERAGNTAYLGKLFANLGNAAYHSERYAEASRAYSRAAETMEAAGVQDGSTVAVLINAAVAQRNLSNVGAARSLYLRAETTCRQLGLRRLLAQTQFNRAVLEQLRGDYREARALLEDAADTFEEQGARDMVAAAKQRLAEQHLELGMPGDAAELAEASSRLFEREGMELDAMLGRLVLARSLVMQSAPEKALPILEDVESYFAKHRIWPRRALARLEVARVELATGHFRESLDAARRAARSLGRHGLDRRVIEANRLIAEALLALDRPRHAERALRIESDLRSLSPGDQASWWELAGRIASANGRSGECIQDLRRAVRLLERQRALVPGLGWRASAFDTQYRVYEELIARLLDKRSPPVDELLSLVDAARGRAFRDWTNLGETHRDDLVDERARLGLLIRQLEESEHTSRDAERRASLQAEVRGLEKKISERVRRLDPTTASESDLALHGPEPTRHRSAEPHPVVSYFVMADRTVSIVERGDRRVVRELPVRPEEIEQLLRPLWLDLEGLALRATRPVSNLAFKRRRTNELLRALFDRLLRPIEDVLPRSGRLTLVPHRVLHNVPFECLHDGEDYVDGRWLIDRATSSRPRHVIRPSSGRPVICGMLNSGLAFVRSEIETIAERLQDMDPLTLGDPSTPELLREVSRASIVHISTHGTFREDNPLFSRLATGDGALFVSDLLGRDVTATLVVLAACNSGRVFTGHGDDLAGIAHAFLAAGVGRLVASRWRVHDEATLALMDAFYEKLASGVETIEALSFAGRQTREHWDHPFYWGSFSAYGT